ncbi:MAG: META domain-containing protein [Bacteroidota bacterium]|nr:META domain-containing protein [Bacteroidota bacterium]
MKSYPKAIGRLLRLILIVMFSTAIISCTKEKSTIVENTWLVESIKIHADSSLKYTNNEYLLQFENKTNYSLSLDVNSCFGSVNFLSNKRVDFKSLNCTEACCDSDFALNTADILGEVNKYSVIDSKLVFSSENGRVINLKIK